MNASRFDDWGDVVAFACALPDAQVPVERADPGRVADVIRRAWWDRAKKAQRAAFGPRP